MWTNTVYLITYVIIRLLTCLQSTLLNMQILDILASVPLHMYPVTRNIQANQHLKNKTKLGIEKSQHNK